MAAGVQDEQGDERATGMVVARSRQAWRRTMMGGLRKWSQVGVPFLNFGIRGDAVRHALYGKGAAGEIPSVRRSPDRHWQFRLGCAVHCHVSCAHLRGKLVGACFRVGIIRISAWFRLVHSVCTCTGDPSTVHGSDILHLLGACRMPSERKPNAIRRQRSRW